MPQINKETRNSQYLKKHAKSLRELLKFDIELTGKIEEILDDPQAWAEKFAEDAILKELPRYQKAKKMGEEFAERITSD